MLTIRPYKGLTACFFSSEGLESIQRQQYSIQDINILRDLGFEVIVASSLLKIPLNCDLYFGWWAAGSIQPLIISRICSSPLIVVAGGNEVLMYRDSVSNEPAGYLASPWWKRLATRIVLKYADEVIVVSHFMLSGIRCLINRPVSVVYNSIDVDKFIPGERNRELVSIVFNSERRVAVLKRGLEFIKAIPFVLEEFPHQKFVVIGRCGDYHGVLLELANSLGVTDAIDFRGSLLNHEIINLMMASKVYVQISDTETFGVAIAEAMSCGTPVVVSKNGAIPEVAGEHAIYVDHNDPKSIASGILKILHMPLEEYHTFSEKSRNRIVGNFSYASRLYAISSIVKRIIQ